MKRAGKCRYLIVEGEIPVGRFFREHDRDYAFFRYFQQPNRDAVKADL